MIGEHKLTRRDAWFIRMGKIDPLTGKQFELGDVIVVCSDCKAPHLKDSWELLGNCSVRPAHKRVASTFSPSLFERKVSSSRFSIKDKIEVTFGEKMKWINWYKPAAVITILLTVAPLLFTVSIESNRAITIASIQALPLEFEFKMAHIGSNLHELQYSIPDRLPYCIFSKIIGMGAKLNGNEVIDSVDDKSSLLSKVISLTKARPLGDKFALLWNRVTLCIKIIVRFIEEKLSG